MEPARWLIVPGVCDLGCAWCNLWRLPSRPAPSLRRLRAQLAEPAPHARAVAGFGARTSEPTTFEGFPGLVSRARSLGYRAIVLSTSGVRLAEPAYARELAARGLTHVELSVPSTDPRVGDVLLGRRGATRAKLAVIDNCLREGLAVHVKVPFVRPALRGLRRSVRGLSWLQGEKGGNLSGYLLAAVRGCSARRWSTVWPRYGEIVWAAGEAHASVPGFRVMGSDVPACVWRRLGGPMRASERRRRTAYEKPEKMCGGCSLAAGCPGVATSYLDAYGREAPLDTEAFAPPPPTRPRALSARLGALRRSEPSPWRDRRRGGARSPGAVVRPAAAPPQPSSEALAALAAVDRDLEEAHGVACRSRLEGTLLRLSLAGRDWPLVLEPNDGSPRSCFAKTKAFFVSIQGKQAVSELEQSRLQAYVRLLARRERALVRGLRFGPAPRGA